MKYNGKELDEFTSDMPVVFDPPTTWDWRDSMTEEQKNCEYCHCENVYGRDFADDDEPSHFKIVNDEGHYRVNAWGRLDEGDFDTITERIRFCPMCGRRLGKEK